MPFWHNHILLIKLTNTFLRTSRSPYKISVVIGKSEKEICALTKFWIQNHFAKEKRNMELEPMCFFVWNFVNMQKKSKRKILSKYFIKKWLNCEICFWPHLDLAFSLVVLKKLFRYVVKTCCYLMFNPSLGCYWMT